MVSSKKLRYVILGIFDKRQHNRYYERTIYNYLPGKSPKNYYEEVYKYASNQKEIYINIANFKSNDIVCNTYHHMQLSKDQQESNWTFEDYPEVHLSIHLFKPVQDYLLRKYNCKLYTIFSISDLYEKNPNAIVEIAQQEQYVLFAIKYIIQKHPNIRAWITLKHAQFALIIKWLNLLDFLLTCIEKRQMYFTPSGVYTQYSRSYEDNSYVAHQEIHINIPERQRNGNYNIPRFLEWEDRRGATINNDKYIQYYFEQYDPKIYVICVRFIATTGQWLIEECEAFHRYSQAKVLQMVGHCRKELQNIYKYTSSTGKEHCREIYKKYYSWHTERTDCKFPDNCDSHPAAGATPEEKYETIRSLGCIDCVNMHNTLYDTKTMYEMMLYDAMQLRHRRLRGVLFCATRLISIARLIKLKSSFNKIPL